MLLWYEDLRQDEDNSFSMQEMCIMSQMASVILLHLKISPISLSYIGLVYSSQFCPIDPYTWFLK